MAIKMTREQYAAKYGQSPVMGGGGGKSPQSSSIGDAFNSGVGQIKSAFSDSLSGKNPLETGAKLGAGVINTVMSPLAPLTAPIGKAVNYAADKISNNKGVQDFAMSKAGETTGRIAEDIGNLNTIAGAATIGQGIPKVGGAMAGSIKPLARVAGKTMKATGEGAYGLTIAPEETTVGQMMTYDAKQPNLVGRVKNFIKGEETGKPITEANTAARQGLVGTEYKLGVQATQASDKLWNTTIKPALAKQKGAVNMKSFISEIEKDIKKSGGDLTRKGELSGALEKVKEDFKKVGKINLEKLQEYKEGWAEFLPDASYKGKPIAGSLKEVHNMMAKKAREIIYNYVGDEGKQAYIDYGNLKSIIKAGKKSLTGDPASRSLTRNVWEFVMNKAVTPVATFAGKVLYRTGEGLEFFGQKGAKTVKDVVDPTTDISPGGRGL